MEFTQALDIVKKEFPRKPEHIQRLYAGMLRDTTQEPSQWTTEFKERLSKASAAKQAARTLFRKSFGSGKYRIESSDAVSVYGTMPNTNQVGWSLYADSVGRAIERLTWK